MRRSILLFALLYKFGDAIGGTMARPFFNEIGFTGPEKGPLLSGLGAVQ